MEPVIYILLTHSGTCFSRLIHFATNDRYTHAAIGLDGPNGPFYSFGRKYRRLILPAGLIEERPGRFPDAPSCLYRLEVSQQVYDQMRHRLEEMYHQRSDYHYNLLGVVSCYFQIPFQRSNYFFCSQFVAAMLEECGALELPKHPGLTRPIDFCGMGLPLAEPA